MQWWKRGLRPCALVGLLLAVGGPVIAGERDDALRESVLMGVRDYATPPAGIEVDAATRSQLERIADEWGIRVADRLLSSVPPAAPGEAPHLQELRVTLAWGNAAMRALLSLPPKEKEVLLRVWAAIDAADRPECRQVNLAGLNWEAASAWLRKAAPEDRKDFVQAIRSFVAGIGQTVALPPRPDESLANRVEMLLERALDPSTPASQRLPQALKADWERVGSDPSAPQAVIRHANCPISHWWVRQILRKPVSERSADIDAYYYGVADVSMSLAASSTTRGWRETRR